MEDALGVFAALDVSQEETAICVVGRDGALLAEAKVPTCPDAIAEWLTDRTDGLERVGMETGPLAVWPWNALTARRVPILCLDARHARAEADRAAPARPLQLFDLSRYLNHRMVPSG